MLDSLMTTPRRLTNEELADISSNWENATVDTTKYYQNVFLAYEVDEPRYNFYKLTGGLCQKYKGKFYIAQKGVIYGCNCSRIQDKVR